MVCLRNICINTPHKGDNDDDANDNITDAAYGLLVIIKLMKHKVV